MLRASGDDEYNDYIYKLCHCDSVETLVVDGREAAADPFVVKTVRNAEALFIAGWRPRVNSSTRRPGPTA